MQGFVSYVGDPYEVGSAGRCALALGRDFKSRPFCPTTAVVARQVSTARGRAAVRPPRAVVRQRARCGADQGALRQRVGLRDVQARLDTLHAHDIYAIARIVVAKDPLLAERRPKWSVQNRDGSGLWRDRIGTAWVDAYNDSVWIYAAQLAQEAVALGFNEVQFDYVRFPDEPKEAMAQALFAARKRGETQREGVQAGIAILTHRIQPLGVPVTFDIFGLTSSATGDLGIGQVWEDFVTVADVVLPMVYPSHYYRGSYGLAWPNGEPYRVVRNALSEALERSRPLARAATIRPSSRRSRLAGAS